MNKKLKYLFDSTACLILSSYDEIKNNRIFYESYESGSGVYCSDIVVPNDYHGNFIDNGLFYNPHFITFLDGLEINDQIKCDLNKYLSELVLFINNLLHFNLNILNIKLPGCPPYFSDILNLSNNNELNLNFRLTMGGRTSCDGINVDMLLEPSFHLITKCD